MSAIDTNYFVTHQYFLDEKKSVIQEFLEVVTLPLRLMTGGTLIDLRGKDVQVLPYLSTSPFVEVALRLVALVFCGFFYRYSLAAAGGLALKLYLESGQVKHRLEEMHMIQVAGPISQEVLSVTLDTTGLVKPDLHPNKSFLYDKFLVRKGCIDDQIKLTIYPFSREKVQNLPLFKKDSTIVEQRDGFFQFPQTSIQWEEWTANFADTRLLGACQEGFLSQEELLAIEHPGLIHLKLKLDREKAKLRYLRGDQIALVTGAKRYGKLEIEDCYGKAFAEKTNHFLDKHSDTMHPIESNLFCFVAPKISPRDEQKPYRKEDLEALFYRAYHAFSRVKTQAYGKKIRIHTGNWGCGAFGNHPRVSALMQIAAAHLAEVDHLLYHPLQHAQAFKQALSFYEYMRELQPHWTVDQFLTDMARRAEEAGFIYSRSDRN